MSDQQFQQPTSRPQPPQAPQAAATARPQRNDAAFDALLDEIDGVLESNAEDYVRSFVQKGGQ